MSDDATSDDEFDELEPFEDSGGMASQQAADALRHLSRHPLPPAGHGMAMSDDESKESEGSQTFGDMSEQAVGTLKGFADQDPSTEEDSGTESGLESDSENSQGARTLAALSGIAPTLDAKDLAFTGYVQERNVAGMASRLGIDERPPRSFIGRREEQVMKHLSTLLRLAGHQEASARIKKARGGRAQKKGLAELEKLKPVEVQGSLVDGDLLLSTNSTEASELLAQLADSPGGLAQLMRQFKPGKDAHRRYHHKLLKFLDGRRSFQRSAHSPATAAAAAAATTSASPASAAPVPPESAVDLARVQTLQGLLVGGKVHFLDAANTDEIHKHHLGRGIGGRVFFLSGKQHAEINIKNFRQEHLANVDPLAKIFGSKRPCLGCHSQLRVDAPRMDSGQRPGFLFMSALGGSSRARRHAHVTHNTSPNAITLNQDGRPIPSAASESHTDSEGRPLSRVPRASRRSPQSLNYSILNTSVRPAHPPRPRGRKKTG